MKHAGDPRPTLPFPPPISPPHPPPSLTHSPPQPPPRGRRSTDERPRARARPQSGGARSFAARSTRLAALLAKLRRARGRGGRSPRLPDFDELRRHGEERRLDGHAKVPQERRLDAVDV